MVYSQMHVSDYLWIIEVKKNPPIIEEGEQADTQWGNFNPEIIIFTIDRYGQTYEEESISYIHTWYTLPRHYRLQYITMHDTI